MAYDASERLLSARDAAGSVTKNSYDALGRAAATVYPDDSRITAVYDARGRVISAVSADGTTDILTRWRALWDEKTKKVFLICALAVNIFVFLANVVDHIAFQIGYVGYIGDEFKLARAHATLLVISTGLAWNLDLVNDPKRCNPAVAFSEITGGSVIGVDGELAFGAPSFLVDDKYNVFFPRLSQKQGGTPEGYVEYSNGTYEIIGGLGTPLEAYWEWALMHGNDDFDEWRNH